MTEVELYNFRKLFWN